MTVGRPLLLATATTRPNTQPHALGAMPTQISGHGPVRQYAAPERDPNNFNATSI